MDSNNIVYVLRRCKEDNIVYVLRRCKKDNIAYNNFTYPKSGMVEAFDWENTKECGKGLHGWTKGFEGYFDDSLKGNFIVLKVDKSDGYIELEDKVKFRKGEVVLNTPDKMEAINYMRNIYPDMIFHWDERTEGDNANIVTGNGSTITAGKWSTIIAGNLSTITAKEFSTITTGDESTITAGENSKITAGDYSNITTGDWSKIIAGRRSTITAGNWSTITAGNSSIITAGDNSIITTGRFSKITTGYNSKITIHGDSLIFYCKGTNCKIAMFYNDEIKTFKEGIDFQNGEKIVIEDGKIVSREKI